MLKLARRFLAAALHAAAEEIRPKSEGGTNVWLPAGILLVGVTWVLHNHKCALDVQRADLDARWKDAKDADDVIIENGRAIDKIMKHLGIEKDEPSMSLEDFLKAKRSSPPFGTPPTGSA